MSEDISELTRFLVITITATFLVTFPIMVISLFNNMKEQAEITNDTQYQIVSNQDADDTNSYHIEYTDNTNSYHIEYTSGEIEENTELIEEAEDSASTHTISKLYISIISLIIIYGAPYCLYQGIVNIKRKRQEISEERQIEAEEEVKAKNKPEYQLRKFIENMHDVLDIHKKIFKDVDCFKTVLDKLNTIHTLAKDNDYSLSSMRTLVNVQLASIEHLIASYLKLSSYDAEESIKARQQIEDTMNMVSKKLDYVLKDVMEDDILNAQVESNVLQQISRV